MEHPRPATCVGNDVRETMVPKDKQQVPNFCTLSLTSVERHVIDLGTIWIQIKFTSPVQIFLTY
jgi:hypothetical protein